METAVARIVKIPILLGGSTNAMHGKFEEFPFNSGFFWASVI